MRPRFDVFRKLEDNRVQFIGTTETLEEAEELALSEDERPCFVLHTAFGVSSATTIDRENHRLHTLSSR